MVRKLDGSLVKSKEEALSEWRNYFSQLLNNRNNHANDVNFPPPTAPLSSILTETITRDEVDKAIKSLKLGKAPGPDFAMTPEVLKKGGEFIVNQVHIICKTVYEQCKAPSQWTTSLIIPLPKKGDLQQMTNYRGISLMSIAAKVYNRVLLNRIQKPIDMSLRKNQAGFRKGRSCTQQIHILRRIIDGAYNDGKTLSVTFIDFKKAFDSIDRDMMFAILLHYGIPEQIVKAIRVLYDHSASRVCVDGQVSEPFDITTGVLQGDVLAPFLFIIVIDYVSKIAEGEFGYLTLKGNNSDTSGRIMRTTTREVDRRMCDLDFADDLALLENIGPQAQKQLESFSKNANAVGLVINTAKTKQMLLNHSPKEPLPPPLTVNGQPIEVVKEFKYLGSYMGSTDRDINARIALAWAAFDKLRQILTTRNGKPTVKLKMRLFDAACISILLYGCESWALTAKQTQKLDVFARTCLRIMLGVNQADARMTNAKLYKLTDSRPIAVIIRERQLQFIGHCLRMDAEEPANFYALYKGTAITTHHRGRPRESYVSQIAKHLWKDKEAKLAEIEIRKYAAKKEEWKTLIAAPKKLAR